MASNDIFRKHLLLKLTCERFSKTGNQVHKKTEKVITAIVLNLLACFIFMLVFLFKKSSVNGKLFGADLVMNETFVNMNAL